MARLVLVVALIALTSIGVAFAAENWRGPGWYQTVESAGGGALEAGPFPDEAACRSTLPANNGGFLEYYCRYFLTEPDDYD